MNDGNVVDLSFGRKPMGHVSGKAVETIAREVIEDWIRMEPDEWRKWRAAQKDKKEVLIDEKGFTRERTMMQLCSVPMYPFFMMGRKLGDPAWHDHDPEALKVFLQVLPECRINSTSGVRCAGDA